jgi:hypothetical protein
MIAGAALVLPSEAECAAHIPPVMYASSLNRAGELFLVVPRRAYRLGERVRVTVGSWNPGLLSLTFPQSGCPAGNPLVLVENRAGRILYPSTPSPLFCPTPGNPLTLASHQSFHRTLTVTIRGPYLRAAAIAGDSKSPGYWTAETSRLRIQLIRTS